jgi:hypothetical protein
VTYCTSFHDPEVSVAAALEVRAAAMFVTSACRKLNSVGVAAHDVAFIPS